MIKQDDYLLVERSCLEQLFTILGCENVTQWDDDILIRRAKYLCKLDDGSPVGEFRELLDALLLQDVNKIVLQQNKKFPSCISYRNSSCLTPLKDTKVKGKMVSPAAKTKDKAAKPKDKKPRKRNEIFSFHKAGIPIGAVLHFKRDPTITCVVVGDPYLVDFGGGVTDSFTNHTRRLLNTKKTTYLSPRYYWTYEGRSLDYYYTHIQLAFSKQNEQEQIDTEKETNNADSSEQLV